jgi:hypothetical protein
MVYPITIEGFEGQKIEVQVRFMRGMLLMVDGQAAVRGKLWGTWVLQRSDGKEVLAAWKPQRLGMDVPQLVVAGKVIDVVGPLRLIDWLWCGLPVLLIMLPNFLPGLFAAFLGLWINIQIFRVVEKPTLKFGLTMGVSLLSLGVYFGLVQFVK